MSADKEQRRTRKGPATPEGKERALANLRSPWQPGESGNPAGRTPRTAGATIRQWVNAIGDSELSEEEVRRIARDTNAPWTKRAAAERILRTLESGDLADFQPFIRGEKTLQELRAEGVKTELVKRVSIGVRGDLSIELHDRAGTDFDRLIGHTELSLAEAEKNKRLDEGKATESISFQQPTIRQLPLPPHLQERAKELPPPREI